LDLLAMRSAFDDNLVEDQQQHIQQQKKEIDRLQGQLHAETEKYEQQVEKLNLLAEELKELEVWKKDQENSNERKLLQYEQQLEESHRKQSDYAEQVELLALKVEAAEFAAKNNQQKRGEISETAWKRRSQELRSELASVRAKYSKLLSSSLQAGERGIEVQLEEIDDAIQLAVESALEMVENEWETRHGALEEQLSNMTEWARSLEEERDAALSEAKEASSSSMQSEKQHSNSKQLKKERKDLKEQLTAELTESLTNDLTEQLTVQLTDALTEQIERKYKKKYKHLRKELKELQQNSSEEKQSQEEMAEQQQQMIEVEMKKVKEQYELEYESKLQELQRQSQEQVQLQKERMRKLVRALLEREAKQKGDKLDMEQTKAEKAKTSTLKSNKRKSGNAVTSAGREAGGKGGGEDLIPVSSSSSSRKNHRSRPDVVPVRGSR